MDFFEGLGYQEMDEFDQYFEETEVRKGTVNPPTGYYEGFVDNFEVYIARNDRVYLKIVIILLSRGWEGTMMIKNSWIDLNRPKMTAKRLKTDLTVLGYPWRGLRSLGDQRKWAQMIGRKVEFKVTHSAGKKHIFTNIWINRSPGMVDQAILDKYQITYKNKPYQG